MGGCTGGGLRVRVCVCWAGGAGEGQGSGCLLDNKQLRLPVSCLLLQPPSPPSLLPGYQGHYTNKQGKVREGSATFWRTSRFRLLLARDILLRDCLRWGGAYWHRYAFLWVWGGEGPEEGTAIPGSPSSRTRLRPN